MTGDFHRVFAGERARRAHHGEQDFIDLSSVPHDVSVMNGVALRGGRLFRMFADGTKTLLRYRQRPRTRKSDHCQAAFAQRRRNRSNGVVKHETRPVVREGERPREPWMD